MANKGIDSIYSWVIALACFWVTFIIQGLVRCSGVVYVTLIDAYEINRAQASWPFTLRIATWMLFGPVAGALTYKFSIRAITFSGVLLVTITNVICSITSDISVITLFLGVMQGLGVGLAATLFPVIINQYFSKYKTTGAGIAFAGGTAGSFVLPPIIEYTIDEYGLRGSFLLMAGITLHGVLGASLMRPAEWLERKSVTVVNSERVVNCQYGDEYFNRLKSRSSETLKPEEIKKLLNDMSHQENPISKSAQLSFKDEKNLESDDDGYKCSLIGNSFNLIVGNSNDISKDHSTIRESHKQEIDTSAIYLKNLSPVQEANNERYVGSVSYSKHEFHKSNSNYDSQISLESVAASSLEKKNFNRVLQLPNVYSLKNQQQSTLDSSSQKCKWMQEIMEPIYAGYKIAKNPMFLVIASNFSMLLLSYMTYLTIIVDHSMDLGIDRINSVFLVSTFSIGDMIGRLGSGWITDGGIVKRKHLMMGNMISVGGILIATPFTTTYISVSAVSVSCGFIVGINLILFYALLEDYLGLRKLPMAVGLMNFCVGVIYLTIPLLTGFFRDTLGSYNHMFHFLGTLSIICGLLWLYEPIYTRRHKGKASLQELAC